MLSIVIPAKAPPHAKSRLATLLSDAERAKLASGMVVRTLSIAHEAAPAANIVLVSNSVEFCDVARRMGASALEDDGSSLNGALELAAKAIAPGDAMLVLPTDLPLLSASDINAMTGDGTDCAIAPNRRQDGTNALFWPCSPRIFSFGVGSFAAHITAATRLGLNLRIVDRPNLAFDLDCPQELFELSCKQCDLLAMYGVDGNPLTCPDP